MLHGTKKAKSASFRGDKQSTSDLAFYQELNINHNVTAKNYMIFFFLSCRKLRNTNVAEHQFADKSGPILSSG